MKPRMASQARSCGSSAGVGAGTGPSGPVVIEASFDLADVDAGEAAWRAGHLPGSHYAHLDRDLSGAKTGQNGRHPLPERRAFAWRSGAYLGGPQVGFHGGVGLEEVVVPLAWIERDGLHAEEILQEGGADLIAVWRQFLFDPFWALHAAHQLGIDPDFKLWPHQYAWWLEKWDKGIKAREASERA